MTPVERSVLFGKASSRNAPVLVRTASSTRLDTLSASKTRCRWTFTVPTLRPRALAIFLFDEPSETILAIWIWRGVSGCFRDSRGDRRSGKESRDAGRSWPAMSLAISFRTSRNRLCNGFLIATVVADRNAFSMFGWLTPSDTTKSQTVGSAIGAASEALVGRVPMSITKARGPRRSKVVNVRPCSLRDATRAS